MPRTAAKPEQPDPLADLRPSEDAAAVAAGAIVDPEPDPVDPEPLKGEAWHNERTAYIVAAWHSDPTSNRFVHHGGQCGCRYLARVALTAAVGVPTDPEPVEGVVGPQGEPGAGPGATGPAGAVGPNGASDGAE